MINPINIPASIVKDESLALNALTNKNLGEYEHLLLQGHPPVRSEVRSKIVQNFSKQEKSKIRDIHLNCSIKNYLQDLKAKCKLDHEELPKNHDQFFGLIYEALNKLDKCKEFKLIMQIVALSDKVKIVFDLNRNSVDNVDPTKNECTEGICYYVRGKIIIGAKGLQDSSPSQIRRVMGVIIHEFCHFALHLLYGNHSKPYTFHDVKNKRKFRRVLIECEKNKTSERLVALVFIYPEQAWHAELIVRVVQMMAFYSDDKEKIEKLKGVYPQLFRYFKDKIVVDLESNPNIVEARMKFERVNQTCELFGTLQNYKVSFIQKELKNIFSTPQLSEQCTILTSNWVDGTLKGIFTQFEKQNKLEGKLFMDLKHFKDPIKTRIAFNAMNYYINATVIVKCDTTNEKKVKKTIEQITNNNSKTKMIFVTASDVKFKILHIQKVEHSWNQLTKKSKIWFLSQKSNFQGLKVALIKILIENSVAASELNLNDLYNGKIMEIGEKLEDVKIHIERKFKPLNAENNDHKVFSFAEILLQMTGKPVFLLAADAGCGKSTELKVIANKLKKKYPSSWVVYIDLKKYTEAFQKDGEIFESLKIAQYFTKSILMLKGFHEQMFVELFEKNRVIFLFDGVDEISPSFKEFVLELIAAITTKTQNQTWIATRKHMIQDLDEKNLTTNAYTIVEFLKDDRERFFDKALATCSDDDKKEILDKVRGFLNNVEIVSWYQSDRMIANVQLLTMIVTLFKENKNLKSNLFSIYCDFVKEFTKNLIYRGHDAVEDLYSFTQSSNVRKYRQKKALEVIFSANTKVQKIVSEIFKNVKKPSNEMITRTGLMNNDGTGNLYFIHQSFSEFFVAEYFYEMLFVEKCSRKMKTVAKLFVQIFGDENHKMMRRFLNEKLENFEGDKLKTSKVLTEAIKNDNKELGSCMMFFLSTEGCIDMIKFISSLYHDREELLDMWRRQDVLRNFTVYEQSRYTLLSKDDYTLKTWSLVENLFNTDQKRKLLVYEDCNGMNILNYTIVTWHEKFFAFFVQKGRELLDKSTLEYEHFFTPKEHLFDVSLLPQTLSRCQKYLEKDEFSRIVKSYKNSNKFLKLTYENQERIHSFINTFVDSHPQELLE